MFVLRPASKLAFQRPPIQHATNEHQRGSALVHTSFALPRTRTEPHWLCNTTTGSDVSGCHASCCCRRRAIRRRGSLGRYASYVFRTAGRLGLRGIYLARGCASTPLGTPTSSPCDADKRVFSGEIFSD